MEEKREGGGVVAKIEEFHSLQIDVDNGFFLVNGRDISKSGKELHLSFENGRWSLLITEDTIFSDAHTRGGGIGNDSF